MTLATNNLFYEAGCEWVRDSRVDPLACTEAARRVGLLAWRFHAGRFADGALENPIFGLAASLPSATPSLIPRFEPSPARKSRTLHVATVVQPVGGHTRVLAKWIAREPDITPLVVLTDQTGEIPEFLASSVTAAGGAIIRLPTSEKMMMRAAVLRELSRSFDRVMLHTNPQDPIPVLAFGIEGGPPVGMFNHAHFGFSFGPTVADLTINTMDYYRKVTERFRFPKRTATLPGTSGMGSLDETVDRREAKRALGLDESAPVAMTIGAETYFTPMEGYDFFRTASRIVREHPDLRLIIVGVRSDSPLVPAHLRSEPRVRCVGPVADPMPYYRAADLSLESFPMPSLGGLTESVLHGEAFPVPVYGPGECILRVSQGPVLVHPYRPPDEDDYVSYVASLLGNLGESRERARVMRHDIVRCDRELGDRLRDVNTILDALSHAPREIPRAPMNDSFDDRILAALSAGSEDSLAGYLPFVRAVPAQITAARAGLLPARRVASQVSRRAWSLLTRALPQRLRASSTIGY